MPTMELIAAAIPGLPAKATGKRETYRDTVVPGLLLEVHASGVRTFVAWGRLATTKRAFRVTLGHYQKDVFGLRDARDAARAVLRDAALGADPVAERRRTRAAGTVGDLFESYLADARHTIRPSTLYDWTRILRSARLAGLRSRATTEVTRGDLIRLFQGIRDESLRRGGKGIAANRALEAVRRTFSWAVERDLIAATPFVGIVRPTRETPRQRAYSDAELGAIVRALGDSANDAAVRLVVFTGVRIAQSLGAPWAEFDLDRKEWTIAGDRAGTKNGLPWLVPLADPVVAFLRARPRDGEWAFPARFARTAGAPLPAAMRQHSVIAAIRAASGVADFRPHDIRRTLNSWLASVAGGAVPLEVRDSILGHRPRGLEAVYNVHSYAEEKRTALARWAAHVDRVAAAVPGESKVLSFPA